MGSLSLHKDHISKLYLSENRTLSNVISYIEKEYGVLASAGVSQSQTFNSRFDREHCGFVTNK
ncbi:hypothetical protein N7455_006793 [Penicillium solitum]|uniref:uncharacterized protein n=1 Tax=Penicillium solitum TaxID=60172 RepID=UPI00182ABCAC|nr:hypothetical protein HAV15_011553 [Penicillium sp. str. \